MRRLVLISLIVATLLSSCHSSRKVVYLQDVANNESLAVGSDYEIRIQPADMLGIVVNSKDHELAAPFNLPMVNYQSEGASVGTQQMQGYLVSSEGEITFPALGKIHVAGMTRSELVEIIERRLIEEEYLKEPIVTVTFQNMKINVIGEVAHPGVYSVGSNKVTIFDALGLAGDLTIYGKRDRVAVIREKNGERIITYHDLRSKSLFNSPYFYLQQNDVVYVEPNKRRAQETDKNTVISAYTSLGTVVISAASLVISLTR